MSKSRKEKAEEYEIKYGNIPKDNDNRLFWLINQYKLSSDKMCDIINKKRNMETNLQYFTYKLVLYEDPEGAKRPRFRLINRKNYMNAAIQSKEFVHVYSPNAADDHKFMHRLIDQELIQLNGLISTPMQVSINTFSHTPSYFNQADTILAELGLHRPMQKPDVDNIEKKYFDSFNYNLWLDDSLIVDADIHKYYSILPRLEIYIRYLNYITNSYQYNQIVNRKDYKNEYGVSYLDTMGNPVQEV